MMSRLIPAAGLALLTVAAGCATLKPAPPERNATVRLNAGLSAYDAGRYAEAFEELAWVARGCPGQEMGIRARSALAALELDPRNRAGRPAVGSELLADLILDTRTPDWLRPVIESTYLLGLGLGAPAARGPQEPLADRPPAPLQSAGPPPDVAPPGDAPVAADPEPGAGWSAAPVRGCGPVLAETTAPTTLPTLPGPSLLAMLGDVELERDTALGRAASLEGELARLRTELAEARAELERIRRTLRP